MVKTLRVTGLGLHHKCDVYINPTRTKAQRISWEKRKEEAESGEELCEVLTSRHGIAIALVHLP